MVGLALFLPSSAFRKSGKWKVDENVLFLFCCGKLLNWVELLINITHVIRILTCVFSFFITVILVYFLELRYLFSVRFIHVFSFYITLILGYFLELGYLFQFQIHSCFLYNCYLVLCFVCNSISAKVRELCKVMLLLLY